MNEMKREGIAFNVLNDGMVKCDSHEAKRFRALLARLEKEGWEEHLAQIRAEIAVEAGRAGIHIPNPNGAACLSEELEKRQTPFSVRNDDGKDTVYWRPASAQDKQEVIDAAFDCIERRAAQPLR